MFTYSDDQRVRNCWAKWMFMVTKSSAFFEFESVSFLFPLWDRLDLGTQRRTFKDPTLVSTKWQVIDTVSVMKDRQTTAGSAYTAAADWCILSYPPNKTLVWDLHDSGICLVSSSRGVGGYPPQSQLCSSLKASPCSALTLRTKDRGTEDPASFRSPQSTASKRTTD